MKKFTLILTITAATITLQSQNNQTYTQMFDSIFNNVPFSTATSGILYDRVANLSGLDHFNQQTTDTSSYSTFIQAYSELNRAVFNQSVNQKFLKQNNI